MDSIPGKVTKQKKKISKKFSNPILEIKNISKFYDTVACDDISFNLFPNEVLGIVGESGSGKTTISNLILRLASPSNGEILYHGKNVLNFNKKDLFNLRFRKINNQVENPAKFNTTRKEIARLFTIINKQVK